MARRARSAVAYRGRLPAELTSLVGRRAEIAEISGLLSAARLVTLTGVGGAGKTRLAIRVAALRRRAFPDGVWLVDLAPVEDAAAVELAIAEALDVFDQTDRPVSEVLTGYLRGRQLLLVLDNCEHVVDACAWFAGRVLREAPGLRLLCTSRQPLGLVGEHVWPVPPLAVPDPAQCSPAGVHGQYAAVELFATRAAAAAGFEVTAANQPAVVEVCRRLDGLPLAIELAAAQLRSRSIHQVAATVSNGLSLLAARHAIPSHHRTMQASFDWSFALCSGAEQVLWTRLAVFHDSFDLQAAEFVSADPRLPADTMLDVLSGLVDQSVLVREETAGRARYRLLETMRQYGLQRLATDGESQELALRRRHRDWYLRLAQRFDADWFGPRQLDWLARLRHERGNLHAALRFSLNTPGEAPAGLELATHLLNYWYVSGLLHEGRHWLERALAASADPTPTRAAALNALCRITTAQGDLSASRAHAEELRALAHRLGDLRVWAVTHRAIGLTAMIGNDLPTAFDELTQAVALADRIGENTMTAAMAHLSLAMTTLFLGNPQQAAAICDQTRALCQANGELWWLSQTFSAASHIAIYAGDLPRATDCTRKALELATTMGNVVLVAVCVERFGWIAEANGDHERAARLLGAADRMWQRIGRVLYGAAKWLRGHDACVGNARAALGDTRYQAAFTSGTALNFDQAVAYALGRAPARHTTTTPAPGPAPALTRREQQVAELVAEGLSNRQIAAQLVISQRTAESHVENILRKLGLTSRTQIVAWTAQHQRDS
jgi:non-specific serine/threonine protein kinase